MDYTFEMTPKISLILRYFAHYGHSYKGPHNFVLVRRVYGKHDYNAVKTVSGTVHRGPEAFNDVFDEKDRLLRRVGTCNDDGKCYGNRLYGHGKCMKWGHEDVTLDTPGVEDLRCAWCGNLLIPKEKQS